MQALLNTQVWLFTCNILSIQFQINEGFFEKSLCTMKSLIVLFSNQIKLNISVTHTKASYKDSIKEVI